MKQCVKFLTFCEWNGNVQVGFLMIGTVPSGDKLSIAFVRVEQYADGFVRYIRVKQVDL